MNTPDRKAVRSMLQHWRWYAKDLPPDSAEINYYTISPMFRDYAIPTPRSITYDIKTAEMVEEVMVEMYKWRPMARAWLRAYWLYIPNVSDLSDYLRSEDCAKASHDWVADLRLGGAFASERTVKRRISDGHDAFAKHYSLLFWGH